mmetsp:Transcript_29228/g.60734  ORF Transcript_29228/g.60734 Transcript_29228/m.60734 type:complete len:1733 (-) Transcript_29228:882-6080(-)
MNHHHHYNTPHHNSGFKHPEMAPRPDDQLSSTTIINRPPQQIQQFPYAYQTNFMMPPAAHAVQPFSPTNIISSPSVATFNHPDMPLSSPAFNGKTPNSFGDVLESAPSNSFNNRMPSAADDSKNEEKIFPGNKENDPSATSIAELTNRVEQIVNSAESREAASRESSRAYGENNGSVTLEAVHGGPLTSTELSQISLFCNSAGDGNGSGVRSSSEIVNKSSTMIDLKNKNMVGNWAKLDGDLLASLTPMLQEHVVSAVAVDLVGEGRDVISKYMEASSHLIENGGPAISIHQWMMQVARYSGPNSAPLGSLGGAKVEPGAGYRRLQILCSGLQSAYILFSIMASPGIDRRAVEDDTIEACVNLIKNHIQKHIIPSLSNTGHLGVASSTSSSKPPQDQDDEYLHPEMMSPMSKKTPMPRRSTPNRNDVAKSLKAVYGPILSTIGLFGTILESAETFIITNEMDDRLLFTVCAASLSSLTIDSSTAVRADTASLASLVQVSAMNLAVAIFRRYPRHRSIITEDLFPLMLKLPTSKRSLRTYLVRKSHGSTEMTNIKHSPYANTSGHEYIQPITALLLLSIQTCVTMPFQSDEDITEEGNADGGAEGSGSDSNQFDGEENKNSKANDTSGLDACAAVCNQFTSQMLQRCSRKGEEGGASEFRPILHNLIDDLLFVRQLPEYPSAEMILFYLSQRLGHDLLRASSMSKSSAQQMEATYLATAMDALGKITSAVASGLLLNRESRFQLPESMSPGQFDPKEEVNRCFCGRGNLDTFMLDCDRCHSWYHGSCVGITKDTVPEVWLCDDCILQTVILEQAKVFARGNGNSRPLTTSDHNHVLRQLLLSHLSKKSHTFLSPQAERAREFWIATWVKELTLSKNISNDVGTFDLRLVRSHVIAQWPYSRLQEHRNSLSKYLSTDGYQRIMTCLVASTELSQNFPRLLGVLLRLVGDGMASIRKLSLKAILQVVNVDPALMAQPSVRKEVSRCFHDEAISVREAAVSLVGDYVLQTPNLATAFHATLLERILDRGVSVRKRIVKIFRDILLTNPAYAGRATACHAMLQRAADRKEDDGVRDLIHETFHILWFNSKAFTMGTSTLELLELSNSTPGRKASQDGTKAELYCLEASKQMVEVVKVSGSPEILTSLVKGLLFGFNEGDKDKKVAERKRRQEDARNQCSSLVSSVIELLLAFEENREQNEDDGKELVALLSTLSVFSEAYPELLVPHIDTLVPYLKGDNSAKKYEPSIVSTVSIVVSHVSSHFSRAELNRLMAGELSTDLVNIAYKFPDRAVSAAVEALCALTNHPEASQGSIHEKKLLKLSIQFYSYLLKTKDTCADLMKAKKSVRDNVRRALSALGSVCRFYECDDAIDRQNLDFNNFGIISDVSKLEFAKNSLSNACFAIFMEYLQKEDEATKVLALRAMNGIFISRPRVVLAAEQMGIISATLSDDASAGVQLESLKCWRDILLAEEKRIESGAAKAKMAAKKNITVSKKISGDQDGDACISGSVLTNHATRLYEMTLISDDKIRYHLVDLIGHLLRQGLINPMETVPYLLALQGDVKCPQTRSLALKLLVSEGEKRPDMLRQRIAAGIKAAFNFQRNVYPRDENGMPRVTALIQNRIEGTGKIVTQTLFDSVWVESSLCNKKAQRQGLYKQIIGLFEKEVSSDITNLDTKTCDLKRHEVDKLPLLLFASQILAHLPYNSLSDPLFIIYHSSCICALDGNEILVRFAALLGNE